MISEQIGNILSIVLTLTGLVVSLFHYISRPARSWIYCIGFLLGNLLSNYYWGAYTFLMGSYPNITSYMAYLGWDICFVFLALLVYETRIPKKRRFISPVALIPIPINIAQFILYIQFGGIINNLIQSGLTTFAICLSINSYMYYLKNKDKGAEKPYVAIIAFIFVCLEHIMWTSSCFDWPSEWLYPYTYAVFLSFLVYILLPWAISKDLKIPWRISNTDTVRGVQKILRPVYIGMVVIFCLGGYFFVSWIKDVMIAEMGADETSNVFSVIAVILFAITVILILFTISILLIFSYGHSAAESAILRKEKAYAEKANAAKSDFLANMSHEIRTPINAVLGMNELILRESISPNEESLTNIAKYSADIESAGNNLLSIINDILDFSKIEAGKLVIIDDKYKLGPVLDDIYNMIFFRAQEKNLKFEIKVDDSLPEELIGDAVRVRQVVVNILNNAVKYTNEGGVKFFVEKAETKAPAVGETINLVFRVSDTGIGIKEEDLEKMFDKFERVDLTKNSTVEGTGLGLAITRNLLDLMGGDIHVESKYGQGSVFTVTIPQEVASAEPVGNSRDRFEKFLENKENLQETFHAPDAHILVVDDTVMNLRVVTGLLKKTEIQIDTAASGMEAMEKAETIPYDIILMDQRMPGMDGTVAMDLIKAQEGGANNNTPFICLTADAVSGAKEKYLSQGFTDYLTKPINRKELEDMLKKYLLKD